MPLVAKFVYGLMCEHKIEGAQITVPRWLQEAALNELHARGLLAKALSGKLMHGRRKIQGHIPGDVRCVIKQMLCQKAGAGAQLKHMNTATR